MLNKIKQELIKKSDEKYKKFACSLLPDINNVLGVRLGELRKMARDILKYSKKEFIYLNDDEFFELTMLEGMVIGLSKDDFKDKLNETARFIKKINNWSICDSFCASMKDIKDNKDVMKNFLEKYFVTEDEFILRFCYVILLNYYIKDDFDYVVDKLIQFNNDKYYAKMAAGWCLSMCIVFDYEKSMKIIKSKKFHPFVLKKGITKAIESLRTTKEQKEELRNFYYKIKQIGS